MRVFLKCQLKLCTTMYTVSRRDVSVIDRESERARRVTARRRNILLPYGGEARTLRYGVRACAVAYTRLSVEQGRNAGVVNVNERADQEAR